MLMNNTCHLKIWDHIEIYRKVKVHIVGGKNKINWIMTLNTFMIKINTHTHTHPHTNQNTAGPAKNFCIDLFEPWKTMN